MEVRNTRFTEERRITRSPTRTGTRKSMWSIDAVTTHCREWRCAANAPARSIQCIRRPPSRALSGFASFGKTISAISETEACTGRGINFSAPWFTFGLVS